jgi:hypothetical protein
MLLEQFPDFDCDFMVRFVARQKEKKGFYRRNKNLLF